LAAAGLLAGEVFDRDFARENIAGELAGILGDIGHEASSGREYTAWGETVAGAEAVRGWGEEEKATTATQRITGAT
jgi:hypothetical protein